MEIDDALLDIAHEINALREQGWNQHRLDNRKRVLLARLKLPEPERPRGRRGVLPVADYETHGLPPYSTESGVRRHSQKLPGAE